MPTITLSLPVAATTVTAGLHSSNYAALQTLLNGGLDTNNISPTAGITAGQLAAGVGAPTAYRKVTSKTVNTTVAATDLFNGEITIGAGVMSTNKVARIIAWGDWLQNSGGTAAPPRLQLILGGTPILDTGTSGTATNSATRRGWSLNAEIMNLGAANSQLSSLKFFSHIDVTGATTNAFTTGEGHYRSLSGGAGADGLQAVGVNPATALDTATSKTLELKVINGSASGSYETKLFGAYVVID